MRDHRKRRAFELADELALIIYQEGWQPKKIAKGDPAALQLTEEVLRTL